MLTFLNAGLLGMLLWWLLCLLLGQLLRFATWRICFAGWGFFCVLTLAYCAAFYFDLDELARAALCGALAGLLVHWLERRARLRGRTHYWTN